MRRLFLPLLILAVVIAASMLAERANRAADAGEPQTTVATDSLGTPIISVRRIPEWFRLPTSNQEFEEALQSVLSQPAMPVARCMRVHRNGIEIAIDNSDTPLLPAELQRLITVAAVESLGTGTVFVTKVVRNEASVVTDGVLEGDIWLVGGGDPVLSTSDYLRRFDDERASTSLEELADEVIDELRRRRITAINGGVIGDEFRFSPSETDYVGTVWTEADNADNVVGPLSGLLVNDGLEWDSSTNTVTRSEDPATLAATVFTDLLVERGLEIASEPTTGEQPASAEQRLLASIESPLIEEIAQRALIDGTTAEMLFKEVGRVSGVSPASNDAAFGMLLTLFKQELPIEGSLPLDGSGLSSMNRLTCDLLMAIIEESPADGIVSSSLKDISSSPLAACAPAGASTLRIISADRGHVTAVAGELTADNADIITFVFIANTDLTADVSDPFTACNTVQTSLLEAIARYPSGYGPALDSITPLAAKPAPDTQS